MLIVMKFGGTSVGTAERIAAAAELAARRVREGDRVVVVTSAMSRVTNQLIAAAEVASRGEWENKVRQELFARHCAVADELFGDHPQLHPAALSRIDERLERFEKLCFGLSMVHELTPRLLDAISGTGEMLPAPLVGGAIAARGLKADAVDATELIVTNDRFGAAEPLMAETREKTRARLLPLLDANVAAVGPGAGLARADLAVAREWGKLRPREEAQQTAVSPLADPAGYESAIRAYFEALGKEK